MATFVCLEFIQDLIQHADAHFASRALDKTVGTDGEFVPDSDDHKYQGIKDAYIRYISTKRTAYRAIFLRKGEDTYWYRAGSHKVEEEVKEPVTLDSALPIVAAPDGVDGLIDHRFPRYLKSRQKRYLREVVAARTLIPHKSMTLISPSLSQSLVGATGLVGRLISGVIEQGGAVTLIARPPRERDISFYRTLVSWGVDLLVLENLVSRLYLFEVNHEQLDSEMQHTKSIAVVGSSELTEAGLGTASNEVQEHLCYEIDESDLGGADDYILQLASEAQSLETYLRKRV